MGRWVRLEQAGWKRLGKNRVGRVAQEIGEDEKYLIGQVRSDNQAENVGEEGGKNQVREERMGRWVRLGKFGEVAQVSAGKGKWKKVMWGSR